LEKRIEEVYGVELAEPVHSKVSVDAISVLSVLIRVDTGAENEL